MSVAWIYGCEQRGLNQWDDFWAKKFMRGIEPATNKQFTDYASKQTNKPFYILIQKLTVMIYETPSSSFSSISQSSQISIKGNSSIVLTSLLTKCNTLGLWPPMKLNLWHLVWLLGLSRSVTQKRRELNLQAEKAFHRGDWNSAKRSLPIEPTKRQAIYTKAYK